MRRYPFYIAIAAALLAVSCSENLEPELPVAEGEGIVLQLNTIDPVTTRAGKDGVKPGEDPYNENSLGASVDIFFYASNADNSTPAITSLSAAVNASTHQVIIPTSTAELRTIFSGHTTAGSKCKVFVIANYNGSTPINHDRQTGYTRSELEGLLLATPTWMDTDPNSNPNFVMTGEAQLTLQGLEVTPPVSGSVDMARVASKVTFSVSVADEITVDIYKVDGGGNRIQEKDQATGEPLVDDDGNPVYVKEQAVMTPHKEAMTVALCFANTYSTLSGTPYISPVNETTDANLFDYPYRHLTASATNSGFYDAEPFYSYPQTWAAGAARQPYLKLIIPWEKRGGTATTKNYYYKIPIPDLKMLRNNWYQIALTVSILGGEEHTPLPVELNYCVAPWNNPTPSAASVVAARYLSLSKTDFVMYNTTELSIPYITSHDCEIVNARWSKPNYSSAAGITYDDGDATDWISLGEDATGGALIKFNHELKNDVNAQMDVTPYTVTFRIRHSDAEGQGSYYRDLTIVQYPGIYIEATPGGNAFVDGFFGHLTQWPSNFSSSYSGNNNYTNGYYYSIGWQNNFVRTTASNNTPQYTPYNRITFNAANGTHNLTRINVTAFNEASSTYTVGTREGNTVTMNDYTYIIGDPRVPSGWDGNDLVPYLTNMAGREANQASATAWTDSQAGSILVGTSEQNIIAPSLYFASYWSRPQITDDWSFEDAQKRCATYQEAGYPAGRWRIPTQAEVYFTFTLQQLGFIPQLFSSGYGYYASDGSAFWDTSHYQTGGNDNGQRFTPRDDHPHSVRCVYDVWYWGDSPNSDTSVYDPQP